jgi:DNA modification methylase
VSVQILIGDCRQRLAELPDGSVHCCVTSPPYFGLRDYGTASWDGGDASCDHMMPVSYKSSTLGASTGGRSEETHARSIKAQATPYAKKCGKCGAARIDRQMGLEPTPDEFVAGMVEVFREVRRVLRDDGTLWLNIGDSYASTAPGTMNTAAKICGKGNDARANMRPDLRSLGVKGKDLIGIPWLLAFALRADGWYLRQDIIWSKPNPMPESVRDRCTKAHEYLFLLSKGPRYYFDAEAVAEPLAPASIERLSQVNIANQTGSDRVPGKTNGAMKAVSKYRDADGNLRAGFETKGGTSGDLDGTLLRMGEKGTRNKRSVWEVATQPFSEAHFATYPPALIEPCILAGCPTGGTVIDPFFGAGTTGLVADRLQRNCIGIELNPEYAEIARRRIADEAGMFGDVRAA